MRRFLLSALVVAAVTAWLPSGAIALTTPLTPAAATEKDDGPRGAEPGLPAGKRKDQAMVAAGEKLWVEQCTHCHGAKAYPGKAPKLKPREYKPEFVWDRVHNGFRGMPPWKDIYKPDEVVALVAYVLSDEFFP